MPTLSSLSIVKLPVSNLRDSMRWYRRVFGAQPILEFPDIEDGVVRGLACEIPGTRGGLALREDAQHAAGFRGFNVAVWSVPGEADIDAWLTHLDELGVEHSPKIEATVGWMLIFHDPDGIEHHLYTEAPHGIDNSDEPRAGRPVTQGAWD